MIGVKRHRAMMHGRWLDPARLGAKVRWKSVEVGGGCWCLAGDVCCVGTKLRPEASPPVVRSLLVSGTIASSTPTKRVNISVIRISIYHSTWSVSVYHDTCHQNIYILPLPSRIVQIRRNHSSPATGIITLLRDRLAAFQHHVRDTLRVRPIEV